MNLNEMRNQILQKLQDKIDRRNEKIRRIREQSQQSLFHGGEKIFKPNTKEEIEAKLQIKIQQMMEKFIGHKIKERMDQKLQQDMLKKLRSSMESKNNNTSASASIKTNLMASIISK